MTLKNYGAIRNLIDKESRILDSSTGAWQSATSELFRCTGTNRCRLATAALGVRSLGLDSAEAFLSEIYLPNELRRLPIKFSTFLYVSAKAEVSIGIQLDGDNSGTWNSDPKVIRENEWTLIEIETTVSATGPLQLPTTATIGISADWSNTDTAISWQGQWSEATEYLTGNGVHYNEKSWVALDPPPPVGTPPSAESTFWQEVPNRVLISATPSFRVPQEVFYNFTAGEAYARMPEYIRTADFDQVNPDVPLFRFIETLNCVSHAIDKDWNNFRYVSPESNNGVAKESSLVNPLLADLATTQWLSQFVGVQLIDELTGFTSWSSLMDAADAVDSIDNQSSTWQEWQTAIGGEDLTLQWNEVEDFDVETVSSQALLSFLRWQVFSAVYGLRGGTTESIIAAAKRGLMSVESPVEVVSHVDGDPFKINVLVQSSDLSDSIENVQNYINPAIPAGFEVVAISVS